MLLKDRRMREIEAIEIVDEFYRAALDHEVWPSALQRLSRAVGGVGSVMLPIRSDGGGILAVSPELVESSEIYLREGWDRQDSPALAAAGHGLTSGIWTDRDVVSAEQRARDPFYQEFRRANGVDGLICALATPMPGVTMSVSVQMPIGRDVEADERALFTALSRHAVRAVSMAVQSGRSLSIQRSFADALSEAGCAAAILDGGNRLVVANAAFERLQPDAFAILQGEIRTADRNQQVAVDRLIGIARRPMLGDVSGDVVLLKRRSGRRPVLLRAAPIGVSLLDRGVSSDRGHVLLLAVDLDSDEGKDPASVLRLLGLTGAESRIAALVGRGVSPKETADILGVAESTVRATLKRIFSKLDVGRQSDLVLLVERVSRGLKGLPR
jgi:DNA-binding CsgD family transcriptional regulator